MIRGPKYFGDSEEAGGVSIFLIQRLFGTSRKMLFHQSGIDDGGSEWVSARGTDEHHRLQPRLHSRTRSPSEQAWSPARVRSKN